MMISQKIQFFGQICSIRGPECHLNIELYELTVSMVNTSQIEHRNTIIEQFRLKIIMEVDLNH